MSDTVFGNAIVLLEDIGFFEVVLPFLLVFTIVFGILEKTKIFGTEHDGKTPKKNLNAMMAFVVAFFVVAAKEVVATIQTSLPLVALTLVAIISFLVLVGAFFAGDKEFNFMEMFGNWKGGVAAVLVIAVILIFFYSLGWIDILIPILFPGGGKNTDYFIIGAFVLAMAGIMFYVVSGSKPSKGDDE